ncbi:prolyl oligopeptidase family serine peptidase [Methylobacillus arboreus]|uniref:alpha/beta hydrolase family protein n=1 Tax=Methylobacillus arboreus TaxID=755170 RepID=UPI001E563F3B|nr:alpha/beta fold hydrolase [Methylobacillus arboreus]MCB5190524.1 prolyl oligopeptidase family serine peptidase [Methylobacillus arboreus]
MVSIKHYLLAASSLLLTLNATISTANNSLLATPAPAEIYGAIPETANARLSPDGQKLAVILSVKGKRSLVIWYLDGKTKPIYLPTSQMEPDWFFWKSNSRLIASLRFFSLRDPFHPSVDTRLLAIDADGKNPLNLINPEKFQYYIPQIQNNIVSLLPNDPDNILISLPSGSRNADRINVTSSRANIGITENQLKYPEVVRVNINTGRLTTTHQARSNIIDWKADSKGNIRAGRSLNEKTYSYLVKRLPDDNWNEIQPYEVNSGRFLDLVAFSETDPNIIYVASNHMGGTGLYELDYIKNKYVKTLAYSENSDLSFAIYKERLVSYTNKNSNIYFDNIFAKEIKLINQAMPGSINEIVDISDDGKRVLFTVEKGNEPLSYWLLDRNTEKIIISPIAETYSKLDPSQIASSTRITYQARDGLTIPALLTLPPGHTNQNTPIPFVVLPHGGPTAHDEEGFDYMVQFIASRGYGVLQPQFRGSTGFGAAFEVAGLQQWGLAMQNDVTDGTHWLIEKNLTTPDQIALVGASYGGYSALMGLVKEPNLYRCAVAIAPVTDLHLLNDDNWHYLFSDINRPRIGTNPQIFNQTSPVLNADKINSPILLIHGHKDYTVPIEHSERMKKALSKLKKPHKTMFLKEADHCLSRSDDRIATLKKIEEFLKENLN